MSEVVTRHEGVASIGIRLVPVIGVLAAEATIAIADNEHLQAAYETLPMAAGAAVGIAVSTGRANKQENPARHTGRWGTITAVAAGSLAGLGLGGVRGAFEGATGALAGLRMQDAVMHRAPDLRDTSSVSS